MESKEFYKRINEYIKEIKKEEIVDFVNNIIRKIPESKFEEILCMINMNNTYLSDIEIKDRINEYNESIKHEKLLGWTNSFEKTSVYAWLLLLNENNEKTKSYSKLISDIFSDIGYSEKENQLLNNDIDEIWKKWKSNFKIDESIKTKAIKWLKVLIENRVEAIMEGNYRKSYNKVALLIVAYGEMISSQNLETKEEYIKYYTNKYSRRSAFKSELNELI